MAKRKKENPFLRRDIDLTSVQGKDGKTMIVVRDPFELDKRGTVTISTAALPLLSMLDGSHSAEEIRLKLVEQTARAGQLTSIPLELVESMIRGLDEAYLLDNERFHDAHRKLIEDFTALRVRPAALAGKSYPEDKNKLEELIDSLLASGGENEKVQELEGKTILAVVAPHIELNVGRKIYSAGYGALKGRSYDRVIILGVGHSMEHGLFSITDKDYTTPLGTVPTDRLLATRLKKSAGTLATEDDINHRSEHSIEFQLLFLQRVLEGPFKVLPVLCSSLFGELIPNKYKRPREIKGLAVALDCLGEMLSDPGSKTLVVAGVDLSHVGPKFGDTKPAIQITAESSRHDRTLLTALTALDVESFCAEGTRVTDRYHVCGFSVLSMLLEILPEGVQAVELGYHVWHEAPTWSSVSFAAAAFYKD